MTAAAVFFGLVFLGYQLDHGLCKIAQALSEWRYYGVRLSLGRVEITQSVTHAPRAAAKGEG